MKLIILFGIVGLIYTEPLSFHIDAGLTGKPFPITRTFLGAAKKTVDTISRPFENAQFSASGNVGGDSQVDRVSNLFERSKSASVDSNIDSSSHQIERSFSSGSQRSLNSARRGSLSLSRRGNLSSDIDSSSHQVESSLRSSTSNLRGQSSLASSHTEDVHSSLLRSTSLGSNIGSSSHQIESGFGAVSSQLGEQATVGSSLVSQEGSASLLLSKSGSLGSNVASSSHQIESSFGTVSSNHGGQSTLGSLNQAEGLSLSRSESLGSNVISSSHQIESGFGTVSSNVKKQVSLDSSLASQASSSLSLSKSGTLNSAIDSSSQTIRNNFKTSSSRIGGIQEQFQAGLAKTNSHHQAASALNVDSSAQHQIESSLSAQGIDSSISEENYPIGYSKTHNFASDSLIESDEARSYDEAINLEELLHRQNSNAHYSFSTDIKDNISDLTQERAEIRDGATVRGHYSYSDGNIRYIVHYVADENGYRVEKQEIIKLDGPKVNPLGTAEIDAKNNDVEIRYGVRSIPINNGTLVIRK